MGHHQKKASITVIPLTPDQIRAMRERLDTDYTLRLQAVNYYSTLFHKMLNKDLDYFLNDEHFLNHVHPTLRDSEKDYFRQKYAGLDMLSVWLRLDHVQKALWLGQLDPTYILPGHGPVTRVHDSIRLWGMDELFFISMTSFTNALKEATLMGHFLHWIRDWPLHLPGDLDTWHHLFNFEKRLLMYRYTEYTGTFSEPPMELKVEHRGVATRPRWPVPSDAGLTSSQSQFLDQTDKTNACIVPILVYS